MAISLFFLAAYVIIGLPIKYLMEGDIKGFFTMIVIYGVIVALVAPGMYKSSKTGSYKQATSRSQIRKKVKERMQIESRYWLKDKYYLNPNYQREMKAHKERWAEPGSDAYMDIQRKEAAWKRGERW